MKASLKELMNFIPQVGKVEWIGLRPAKVPNLTNAPLLVVDQVAVSLDNGLEGDRYHGKSKKRQVTLIQKEHLEVVAKFLGKGHIDPSLTRRNIVISGINLLALKQQQFQIGEVILETTGDCHPCSRMETNLGAGGYNAMRGHGGITARVIKDGKIQIGDTVKIMLST